MKTLQRPRSIVQRGFTLMEMAIVLAIIGLIIGAIVIGKDVQRNAESFPTWYESERGCEFPRRDESERG